LDGPQLPAAKDIRDAAMHPSAAPPPDAHAPALAAPDTRSGIQSWPAQDRPRERMLAKGPAALSNAELLALLLRSGNRGLSALDLARRLLQAHGALGGLLAMSAQRMARLPGLGPARAASLLAVLELARRAQMEKLERKAVLGRPQAVKDYLCLLLNGRAQEVFVVLFLDSQNRLILADELFRGTLNQTAVYPREVVRRALELNAAAVILAHNHPSGVAEPSQADRVLTDALRAALRHLDMPVLDHIIVAGACSYSFAEHGHL
jgi:DNA repair protein RadC